MPRLYSDVASLVEKRAYAYYHLHKMITLGVDSSEVYGGAALIEDGRLLGEMWMDEPLRHSEELLPLVAQLFDACGIDRTLVNRVSVNRGPGSFTGLRIGIATAKGFAQALGIPVVGVDGTIAYRARLPETDRVCVIVKNRRDLFYVRWFIGMRPKGEVTVATRVELLRKLSRLSGPVTVVGSGAEELMSEWDKFPQVTVAASAFNRPSPEWVARLGQTGADELYSLDPVYVEPAIVRLVS